MAHKKTHTTTHRYRFCSSRFRFRFRYRYRLSAFWGDNQSVGEPSIPRHIFVGVACLRSPRFAFYLLLSVLNIKRFHRRYKYVDKRRGKECFQKYLPALTLPVAVSVSLLVGVYLYLYLCVCTVAKLAIPNQPENSSQPAASTRLVYTKLNRMINR